MHQKGLPDIRQPFSEYKYNLGIVNIRYYQVIEQTNYLVDKHPN